jgi:hypothetical protein
MAKKQIINGIGFQKISPVQIEIIEAECRQYRSEYVFSSVKSVFGLLKNPVQRLFGQSRECGVN